MNNALTLHAYMYSHGENLNENRRATAFKVKGLPVGEEAWIAEFNHRWKLRRATAGTYGEWQGKYSSPDEAIGMMRSANIVSPPLFHYCPCCNEPVPHAIAYGLENLQKDEGNVVTVCFICEHKQVWTDLQAKARLRELIG
jgi:hypothetical protein